MDKTVNKYTYQKLK